MPSQHEKHRPVIGGIMIGVAFTRLGNMLLQQGKGTLTGVATRLSDNKTVLVTCLHLVSTRRRTAGFPPTALGPVTGQ